VDESQKSGGNKKSSGITLCLSENPLTAEFARSLLENVPESAHQPGR
jgi:hypothetical protein